MKNETPSIATMQMHFDVHKKNCILHIKMFDLLNTEYRIYSFIFFFLFA